MKKMYGITTAMLIPYDEKGNVMIKELEEYTEFLISKGIHCLYPLGSMGEMHLISVEQRKIAAETIVKTANGRVPVFVHIGAMSSKDTFELAKHAYEIGADGIGAVTPSYWPFKRKEVINFYKELSNIVPEDFPIYMYNIPQYSTIDLTLDMVEEITASCKNIVGIKYSVQNLPRTQEYLSITNNDFSVIQGGDLFSVLYLTLGCDGIISGYSAAFPEYFVKIYDLIQEGKVDEAIKVQKEVTELSSYLKKEISTIPKLKTYLKLRGINMGYANKPFMMPDEQQTKALAKHLEKYYPNK